MRRMMALLVLAASLSAQGTKTRAKAEEYPVYRQDRDAAIGAEYMIHSVSDHEQTIITKNHLVVDVAIFPLNGKRIPRSAGQFQLRINNKTVLTPVSSGAVVSDMKYDDYELRPHPEASIGMGDTGVVLGRPRPQSRFPGDPRGVPTRVPPRVPSVDQQLGHERTPAKTLEEFVQTTALPEGEGAFPISGYVYFAYRGKLKSIKSLELLYIVGDRQLSLPLL